MSFHEAINGINTASGQAPTQGTLSGTAVDNSARREAAVVQAQLVSDNFTTTDPQKTGKGRQARLDFAQQAAPQLIQEKNNTGILGNRGLGIVNRGSSAPLSTRIPIIDGIPSPGGRG